TARDAVRVATGTAAATCTACTAGEAGAVSGEERLNCLYKRASRGVVHRYEACNQRFAGLTRQDIGVTVYGDDTLFILRGRELLGREDCVQRRIPGLVLDLGGYHPRDIAPRNDRTPREGCERGDNVADV